MVNVTIYSIHGSYGYIGNVIIPIDELIFFRGVGSANQPWNCLAGKIKKHWLVVSHMNFIFHFIYFSIILPIDELIFFQIYPIYYGKYIFSH